MSVKHPNHRIRIFVFHYSLKWKSWFMEKNKSVALLEVQNFTSAFLGDKSITLEFIRLDTYCQIHYPKYYKESRINNINISYCFIKGILEWIWLFYLVIVWQLRIHWILNHLGFLVSGLDWGQQFYLPCLCNISLNVSAVKKAKIS